MFHVKHFCKVRRAGHEPRLVGLGGLDPVDLDFARGIETWPKHQPCYTRPRSPNRATICNPRTGRYFSHQSSGESAASGVVSHQRDGIEPKRQSNGPFIVPGWQDQNNRRSACNDRRRSPRNRAKSAASGPGVRRMVMGVRHRILRGAEPLYVERKGRIKDSPRVT
jgi:hypothetical protein